MMNGSVFVYVIILEQIASGKCQRLGMMWLNAKTICTINRNNRLDYVGFMQRLG